MSFTYTTALSKIRHMRARKKIISGGTAASKTFSILPILLDKIARKERLRVSVVSESIPHLRRGAIRDFETIARDLLLWDYGDWNKANLTFTIPNRSFIEFFSADDEARLRGPRRDVLYLNEANNVDFDAYFQMAVRTGGDIFIDYNPTHEFWADREFEGDKNAEFLTLTYRDNEACPQSVLDEIELAREKANTSEYWANWVRVYADGQRGKLEGVVFDNWKVIDKIPGSAVLVARGLDFGYTNDPSVIVNIYEFEGKYIIDERLHQRGLLNSDLAKYLDDEVYTYCDSAEPKSIEELSQSGITRATAARKGPDSVRHGIQVLQGLDLLVTSQSTNLIKELRNYSWDRNRQGEKTGNPVGVDHCIDALRYGITMHLAKPKAWPTFWV